MVDLGGCNWFGKGMITFLPSSDECLMGYNVGALHCKICRVTVFFGVKVGKNVCEEKARDNRKVVKKGSKSCWYFLLYAYSKKYQQDDRCIAWKV